MYSLSLSLFTWTLYFSPTNLCLLSIHVPLLSLSLTHSLCLSELCLFSRIIDTLFSVDSKKFSSILFSCWLSTKVEEFEKKIYIKFTLTTIPNYKCQIRWNSSHHFTSMCQNASTTNRNQCVSQTNFHYVRFCKFKVNTYTKYYCEPLQPTRYILERLIELFVIDVKAIRIP